MKHYVKKRPFNFAAVAFATVGFWLQFRAFKRIESLFDEGSMAMGFSHSQMGWLNEHQGQLGVICLSIAVILYLKDHHNESKR